MNVLLQRPWFSQMADDQQDLVQLSVKLYEREIELNSQFTDYSFIIFPIAKAYEGFIKQYLYDLELISQNTFEGRRFRLGRALNPDIHHNQRDEFWLFDDIVRLCGEELARQLWNTWLESRNRVFHYFPSKNVILNLPAVEKLLYTLDDTLSAAHQCKLELQNGSTQQ